MAVSLETWNRWQLDELDTLETLDYLESQDVPDYGQTLIPEDWNPSADGDRFIDA